MSRECTSGSDTSFEKVNKNVKIIFFIFCVALATYYMCVCTRNVPVMYPVSTKIFTYAPRGVHFFILHTSFFEKLKNKEFYHRPLIEQKQGQFF